MLSGIRFDVTSAEDVKEKSFLLEKQGFVESQHFRNVLNGDYRFIVGRKGGGKTAMFFQTGLKASRSGRLVIEMSLTECPPKQFFQQVDKLLQRVPDEAMLLRNIWRYTIGLAIMHRLRADPFISARLPRNATLRAPHNTVCAFLEHVGFKKGGIEHEPNIWTITDLLVSKQADLFFAKHLPSEAGKYFPTGQDYIEAESAMCELLRMRGDDHKGAMILIDDLDKWIEETNYPRMTPFVRGLLEAATDCESISMARGDVRIQTYIPEDLFAKVKYRHEDKLSHIYHLRYHTTALRQMLARRILAQTSGSSATSQMSDDTALATIQRIFVLQEGRLPSISHRWNIGRDAFQYIVSHTLYRPRDLWILLDRIQKRALGEDRSLISPADVENGVKEGCRQIARRIVNEYATRMPYLESIIAYFTDGFNAYRYVEIKMRLADAIKHSASIGKMERSISVEELLDDLYEIGFLGKFTKPDTTNAIDTKPIQPVDNRRYATFSFRVPTLNLLEGEVVVIHPLFWPTLNLQERRTEFDVRGIVEPTDAG